jgi:hypothetical protein
VFQLAKTHKLQINSVIGQAWEWVNATLARRITAAVFVVAALLRVIVMFLYTTPVLVYYGGDSTRYLRLASTGYRGLFSDPSSPAGYPVFLDIARSLDKSIAFTIGLQHLIGLATAGFLLLTVRKVGSPVLFGLIPATIVLFSGDFIFLETTLLTETLWMVLLAAGLWAGMSARKSCRESAWLIAAGTLLAMATLVRSLSLPLVGLIAIWAMWELDGSWRRRVRGAVAVVAPAAVIVFSYSVIAHADNGYAGLTDMRGFNLYARVGQFANCHDFSPPEGASNLCEYTSPNNRYGPFYYTYGVDSPIYRTGLHADPRDAQLLGRFADEAILHQPFDYLQAVSKDLLRYIVSYAIVVRPDSGVGPMGMSFGSSTPANQGQTPRLLASEFSNKYSDVSTSLPGQGVRELLGSYQEIFRLSGLPIIILALLSAAGLFVARAHTRRALILFLSVVLYLYVAPVALSSYDVRYGVPAGMFLGVSGALGSWVLARRVIVGFSEGDVAYDN